MNAMLESRWNVLLHLKPGGSIVSQVSDVIRMAIHEYFHDGETLSFDENLEIKF